MGRWLDVAVALAPGADAHPAEELENALSHSLVKAPAVLKRSADTEQEYRAALQAARRSVTGVHDKKLKDAKTRCLAAIDEQLHKKDPVQ